MRLIFFLIGVALILLRLCYPSLEIWQNGRGQGSMITKSDNYIRGIWWSGKYRLADDDRSIAELSPGGFLKFRENDTIMKVESGLDGKISYLLDNGSVKLPLNDSGRNFLAAQLQKMIRVGFFGEERAKRIYQNGGVNALLTELSRIKFEGGRDPYLKLLLHSDSLTVPQKLSLLRLIDSTDDREEQREVLKLFSRDQLRDSVVAHQWLSAVGHIDEAYIKKDLLLNYADSSLNADRFDSVIAITSRFGSDVDQSEIYKSLIALRVLREHDSVYAQPWLRAVGSLGPTYMKQELFLLYLRPDSSTVWPVPADQFDTVLAIAARFGSSFEEQEIYKQLAGLPGKTDAEWAALVRATGSLNEDFLKSELLLQIAPNMPRTDSLRTAYRMAAKSIQGDMEYGKTMRALEDK